MLKGLPASGKSTYAKELVKKGWKRVNKDDLRAMIDDSKWSRGNEKIIKDVEQNLVFRFLRDGFNVVVDDTNFAYEEVWRTVAITCGVAFESKFFDVSYAECIERDATRGDKSVGAEVIQRMYDQYLKPNPPEYSDNKQNVYVFDIDGTLAHMNGRSPYDYTKVDTDVPNYNITMIARSLRSTGIPVIIVSGREDSCKEATMQWLAAHNLPFNAIHMRKTGDDRKDTVIKREIYEEHLKDHYNIIAVFDDRNQVVDMWRSLGLTCLQVYYGNF